MKKLLINGEDFTKDIIEVKEQVEFKGSTTEGLIELKLKTRTELKNLSGICLLDLLINDNCYKEAFFVKSTNNELTITNELGGF